MNLFPSGSNQNGSVKLESLITQELLHEAVKILKKTYKIAKKREDINAMFGVADRFTLLFEGLSDPERTRKQHPVGFARFSMEEDNDSQ